MTRLMILMAAFLGPGVAAAHPDHITGGTHGFGHYLTDPFHIAISATAVLLFLAARRYFFGRRRVYSGRD